MINLETATCDQLESYLIEKGMHSSDARIFWIMVSRGKMPFSFELKYFQKWDISTMPHTLRTDKPLDAKLMAIVPKDFENLLPKVLKGEEGIMDDYVTYQEELKLRKNTILREIGELISQFRRTYTSKFDGVEPRMDLKKVKSVIQGLYTDGYQKESISRMIDVLFANWGFNGLKGVVGNPNLLILKRGTSWSEWIITESMKPTISDEFESNSSEKIGGEWG